jgi:recombination protein RecR
LGYLFIGSIFMRIPKAIQDVIESFERLPGIGPKSAQRLTFYLLHVPQHELDRFAAAIQNLKNNTKICSICYSVDQTDPCSICSDTRRDSTTICVVEQPLDVLALERNGQYTGVYHVLHGKIDPLNNIGPDEIYIQQLIQRVKEKGTSLLRRSGYEGRASITGSTSTTGVKEIILATNPTMEGEATAMYLAKLLKALSQGLRVTRIGRGLPTGADLEYADGSTLQRAMEGRNEY